MEEVEDDVTDSEGHNYTSDEESDEEEEEDEKEELEEEEDEEDNREEDEEDEEDDDKDEEEEGEDAEDKDEDEEGKKDVEESEEEDTEDSGEKNADESDDDDAEDINDEVNIVDKSVAISDDICADREAGKRSALALGSEEENKGSHDVGKRNETVASLSCLNVLSTSSKELCECWVMYIFRLTFFDFILFFHFFGVNI